MLTNCMIDFIVLSIFSVREVLIIHYRYEQFHPEESWLTVIFLGIIINNSFILKTSV